MLERMIEVRDTSMGHGVFALREFPTDVQVGIVTGRLIEGEQYSSDYAIDFTDSTSLEPDAPFCFLNHSCEPNCELVVWRDEEEETHIGELCLFTLRNIEPGEELTIDYSWPAEHAIRCLCGQPACRGWIVAEDDVSNLADF